MTRKILVLILAGIISVLLIAGCSSQAGDQNGANTDTTQTDAQDGTDTSSLPSEAEIGIAFAQIEGKFAPSFVKKLKGYLVSAGVPEERIEVKSGEPDQLADLAGELIDGECSVLIVGEADAETAPKITDAAAKAGIPVLYFGTDPGEKETSRWEKEQIRAAYIGSTYAEAPAKRADILEALDFEAADESGDGELGIVVIGSGEETAGDTVNQETVKILRDSDLAVNFLQEEADEPDGDEDAADEEEAEENADADAADEEEAEEDADADTADEEEAEENADADAADEEEAEDEDEESSEEEASGDPQRAKAREEVISCMDEYGKELEVILCSNDMQALGALDAVTQEKQKVGHDVLIFGFNCNRESLQEAAAGNIRSTFFNDFMDQSGKASEAVLAFLRGDSVEPRSTCEYVSVTVDNAQEILDIATAALEGEAETDGGEDENESGGEEDGDDADTEEDTQ